MQLGEQRAACGWRCALAACGWLTAGALYAGDPATQRSIRELLIEGVPHFENGLTALRALAAASRVRCPYDQLVDVRIT